MQTALTVVLFLLVSLPWQVQANNGSANATGQTVDGTDTWKEFSPTEAGFTVLLPAAAKETIGSVQLGSVQIQTHEYEVRSRAEYRIVYFNLTQALVNDKSKRGLLLGLRNALLSAHKGSLASVEDFSVDGTTGLKLEISGSNGKVVRAILLLRECRVYQVTAESASGHSDDSIKAANASLRFLESFKLVPIVSEASDDRYLNNEEGEVDRFLRDRGSEVAPELPNQRDACGHVMRDGTINGRALKLVQPRYPSPPLPPYSGRPVRANRASGLVMIRVIIDETGAVIAAQVISGHPELRDSCLEAARKSRFNPTLREGKPVKVLGKIAYNFLGS